MIFDDLFLPFFILEPAPNPAPEFSLRMAAALEGDLAIENRTGSPYLTKREARRSRSFPFPSPRRFLIMTVMTLFDLERIPDFA